MRYNNGNERFGKDGSATGQPVRNAVVDASFGVVLRGLSPVRLLR